jgi:DNA-binding HxlR family transcriptional regulator
VPSVGPSARNGAAERPERIDQSEVESLRAGERILTLLSTPLNFVILRALAERPMRLAELRQATGLPAQTTLRGHLSGLGEIGVVEKRPTAQMPYAVENELTPMGEEVLRVAEKLEAWLQRAPDGRVSLETGAARGVVKAFVDGWGSTMTRSLAERPMSLTELDREIPALSYPALERRLSSMRMAGLIEACPGQGNGTPYVVTEWARRGIVPLAAATNCEHVHMRRRAVPVRSTDIEAALLLAAPLAALPPNVAGSCRLEVEGDPRQAREVAGVKVTVEAGRVVACDPKLLATPGPFAAGPAEVWFDAISGGKASLLRVGGGNLAPTLISALHAALILS